MATPTDRSLQLLRKLGFLPAVVECWIPKIERRRDLWHFGDILACHPRDRIMLIVQATSTGNVAARLAKASGRAELALWLRAGGAFEVWGWDARGVKRVSIDGREMQTCILDQPGKRKRQGKGLFDGLKGIA
jgi:hypothetical protein